VAHHDGTGAPGADEPGRHIRRRCRHTPRRRWPVAAAAALIMLVTAGCGASSSSPSSLRPGPGPLEATPNAPAVAGEARGTGSRSDVTGGALFGGNAALAAEEGRLGRKLAIVRDYYKIGESFPTPKDSSIMAAGSTLLVSLDTKPNGPTYASIIAGHYDATIRAFLEEVNRAAIRYHLAAIYFAFEHEADLRAHHHGLGTPAQFVQAWDHVHELAQSAHLNWTDGGRIHWVWDLSYQAFVPRAELSPRARQQGAAAAYWPGSNEVDIVAADGYETYGCPNQTPGQVRTASYLFGPVIKFAHEHGGLPVFIPEWGATSFPSSQWQTLFIKQMQAFITANPEIAAVLYWDSPGHHTHCNFTINANPASVAAMARIGRSRALQGHVG
jgi:hypothetical protein